MIKILNIYGKLILELDVANLSKADLSEANLSEADLSKANLSEADLSKANLRYANLSKADLSKADLRYANLSKADLSDANLRYANLSEADLSDANLRYADLSDADLRYADLSDANLSRANLSKADLSDANLSRADLRYADLSDAKGMLCSIDFLSQFEKSNKGIFVYKTFNAHYTAPPNWNIETGSIISEEVNPCRTTECGSGINVSSIDWIKANIKNTETVWKLLIKWEWLVTAVVPYNTDGKFRVGRAQLVEEVNI